VNSETLSIRIRAIGADAAAAAAGKVRASWRGLGDAAVSANLRARYGLDKVKAKLSEVRSKAIEARDSIAGIAAGAGLTYLAANAVKTGFAFEDMQDKQRIAFSTILGDGAKARRLMGDLQALAIKSPVIDVGSAGSAAQSLLAYGINAKKIVPWVEAIGNVSAVSGKSLAEVMPLAARAIGQIEGKGKLQTEELNQLAEGVGLSQKKVRQQLGMTKAEWADSFTPNNNISSEKALPAILAAMKKMGGRSAEEYSKTFGGRLSAIKDIFAVKMGAAVRPVRAMLNKQLGKGVSFLQGIDGDKIGQQVAGVASGIGKVVGQVMNALKPAEPFLKNVLIPLLKGVGGAIITTLVGAFRIAIPVLTKASTFLGWLGTKARPLRGVFQGVGYVIGTIFFGAVVKAIAWVGRIIPLFGRLLAPVRMVGGAFQAVGARVAGAARRIIGGATRIVAGIIRPFTSLGARLVGFVGGALSRIATVLRGAPAAIASAASGMFNGITDAFKTVVNGLGSIWNSTVGKISFKIPGWVPALGGKGFSMPKIPQLYRGGEIIQGGLSWVGERGPELLNLPAGASVMNNADSMRAASTRPTPPSRGSGGGIPAPVVHVQASDVNVDLHMDTRKVGQAQARQTRRELAITGKQATA
jgi:tape measure domain-containing protein